MTPSGSAKISSAASVFPFGNLRSPPPTPIASAFASPAKSPSVQKSSSSITAITAPSTNRSEEHTSELQSHLNLVCRLLLEKKKPPPVSETPLRRRASHHCITP